MSAQHTPGPWEVHSTQRNRGESYTVGRPGVGSEHTLAKVLAPVGRPRGTNEANARLIAAAPELLEVIAPLLAIIDEGVSVNISDAELRAAHPEDRRFIKKTRATVQRARTTLAKATGELP